MAREVGIVMKLYDQVSPTLKSIAGSSRAFDKTLDELEESLKAYERSQDALLQTAAEQKSALQELDLAVKDARKSYQSFRDETSKGALDEAIRQQVEMKQALRETEAAIADNTKGYKTLLDSARQAAVAARGQGDGTVGIWNSQTHASIPLSATDTVAEATAKMGQALSAFGDDAEGLRQRLDLLEQTRLRLEYVDLNEAQREVDRTAKVLDELADATDEVDAKAAVADFDQAVQNYENLRQQLELVSDQARQTAQDYSDATNAISRADNRAGTAGDGFASILGALGKAGLMDMAGDVVLDVTSTALSSAFGSSVGGIMSSALGGAVSGAAMGSLMGPVGTAVGAAIGGGLGLIQGGTQVAQEQDEAFQSYVQNSVEGQLDAMDSIQASGSAIAGQREQDQIAFAQRLGSDEAARDYLEQVKAMAINTNYTYDEITGYSKSLLNTYDPDETFSVLQKLSDATAGLNLNSGDVDMFISGLSRMRTTGKVTQEYMDYYAERGLDVDEAIARGIGVDKSQVRGLVSDGAVGGMEAAQAILDYIQEEFGGLSEKLASTYDAMVDNLEDAEANLNARMGEGYNEARKSGIAAQQDWLNSDELGAAYEAIGAWKAELENAKEQYIRDAVDQAMGSEEYQSAEAAGDAAEMGRMIMQAKIQGMNEYNANEGKDEVLAQEIALIDGVRADASVNESYWNAGYTLGQAFSKGRAAGMADSTGFNLLDQEDAQRFNQGIFETQESIWAMLNGDTQVGEEKTHALGLDRVPYDDYPALLHEGERVLTAREARELDRLEAPAVWPSLGMGEERGGETAREVTRPIQITITGNTFGGNLTAEGVAQALVDEVMVKLAAGYRG